jgi:hypothetical protein
MNRDRQGRTERAIFLFSIFLFSDFLFSIFLFSDFSYSDFIILIGVQTRKIPIITMAARLTRNDGTANI